MTAPATRAPAWRAWLALATRLVLGGVFVVAGALKLPDPNLARDAKTLFSAVTRLRMMSRHRIYELLCQEYEAEVRAFAQHLSAFLGSP